jgi:thiosulfate dehydrogenase (quinone) large subunit
MSKFQRLVLFLLRVGMGWLCFHAGIVKVMNSSWSAAGYLNNAKNLEGFYHWLASPALLPVTNFINEWALTLLGVSLILGIFVRWSAVLGAALMVFYYLPLNFPKPDANSYVVDDHIVYALVMLYLAAANAGRVWGLDGKLGFLKGSQQR